jgi:hypothetical protein
MEVIPILVALIMPTTSPALLAATLTVLVHLTRSKDNRDRVRRADFLPKLVNLLKMSRHLLKNSLVKQKTIQLTINVATSNPTNKLLLQRVRGASLPSARPPFCAPNHPQRSPANAHRAVSVPPP